MDSGTLCVICHSKLSPTRDNYSPDYSHASTPKILSKEVDNYFLLRHVFNLSSEQLRIYLRYCPRPQDWVKVCFECHPTYVDRCTRIYLELLEVKSRFRAARNKLVEAVKRSVSKEPTYQIQPYRLDIGEEVRRFVAEEYEPEIEEDGDHSLGAREATNRTTLLQQSKTSRCEGRAWKPSSELDVGAAHDAIKVEFPEGFRDSEPEEPAVYPKEIRDYEEKVESPKGGGRDKDLYKPELEEDRNSSGTSSSESVDEGTVPPNRKERSHRVKVNRKLAGGGCTLLKCDMCGMDVPPATILEHVRGHVGDFAIKCPNDPCPYVFSNSKPIRKHQYFKCRFKRSDGETEKEFYVHTCETCGFKTSRWLVFKKHLKGTHEGPDSNSSKNYTCPMADCEASFMLRQSVDIHLSTHATGTLPVQKCELCPQRANVAALRNHLLVFHKRKEIISCPQCPSVFATRAYLVEHVSVQHRRQGYFCDICGKDVTFREHRAFRQHYETEHQVDFAHLTCKLCKSTLISRDVLKRHVILEHGEAGPALKARIRARTRWTCDLCPESPVIYTNKGTLASHKVQMHGGEPLECKTCGQRFISKSGLENHTKAEHLDVKMSPCPAPGCGKVFNSEYKLKMHFRLCHEERKHVCFCGKSFMHPHLLKIHRDTVHLGCKPHVCEVCGRSFATLRYLRRHKMVHTGERPHQCSTCGQRFLSLSAFKGHIKLHAEKGDSFKPRGPLLPPGERKTTRVKRKKRENGETRQDNPIN